MIDSCGTVQNVSLSSVSRFTTPLTYLDKLIPEGLSGMKPTFLRLFLFV